VPVRDVARRAVIVDDARMVHGEVRRALIEVRDRISARLHHVLHQPVGLRDGSLRVVDEARLYGAPLLEVSTLLVGAQRPDVELFDALLALHELRLRAALVADLGHGALVLGPVSRAELLASLALPDEPAHHREHEYAHDHRNHRRLIHGSLDVSWFSPSPVRRAFACGSDSTVRQVRRARTRSADQRKVHGECHIRPAGRGPGAGKPGANLGLH
jgi:hypothetical protein